MNEEQKLIKQIVDGDEEALRRLYDITARSVYQYIFNFVNNKETAEDLMIETYTQVWLSAKRFKGDSRILTWILGIARNLTMNEIKKRDYRYEELKDTENQKAEQFRLTAENETEQLIYLALKKLSLKHREILDLIFIHELTYEEVAKILDIPLNTVKTRIFYAKEKLREILENMGVNKDAFF
ncbi:sigma-70 family RNA polymerase sigma factor [Thermodesulfovibrio sp.]|jgi:RNA polymerase sigma-70 factor (ECF subfamily)|uniref:RNA polymerase sigma factor n=1 Tax=Thermodesulfovibrio TaxID=28261 RepID=UPI002626B074|nr:sigma-70 family RNA polymerase sigma factor [Thermodesulfovibrio sp.]